MTDSLIVGGYELIGATTNPEYRLAPDWDFGEGEPDTVTISSQFLDGDAVVGDRTANRTIKLPVMVYAASRTDLTSKIDLLRRAVNASWALTWTPDQGLPLVFDCFRAKVTRVRDCVRDAMFSADVTIDCPALPFGRSPTQQSITVAARSQLDSFDTAPTTGATLDTTTKIEGTGSAKITANLGAHTLYTATYAPSTPVSRTFAARDYSLYSAVAVQVGYGTPTNPVGVTLTLTLTSASGSTTYPAVTATFNRTSGTWQIPAVSLAGGTITAGTGVTLTAVTGYSVATSASVSLPGSSPASTINYWLDDAEMVGSAAALTTTTRGTLLLVPNVIGSARTPVSIAATGTINSLLAHRPPADQDANLQILTGVTVAASPSHPAATTIAANNAHFNGTYSAVLGVSTVGAAGANTLAVTITQLENGASVASQVLNVTYTSPQADRLVKLGEITLPLRAVPTDNTTTTYTIDVNHTAGADTYSDFMLLDTRGQTVIADPPAAVGAVYLDAPTMLTTLGNIYASAAGNRTDAYGILDTALITGGPFVFDPGNNRMLVWSDTAAPTLTVTYYPRWLDERVA